MPIHILASRCVGCGQCISICPYDALAVDDDLVALLLDATCTDCKACIYFCPVEAIENVGSLEGALS